MSTPAVMTARGIVRSASTISSPIVDPLSTPPNANAIVERNTRSLSPVPGVSVCAVMGVADPDFIQEYRPNATRNPSGIHPAIAPALLNHFPMLSPTTLSATAIVRPTTETVMKYGWLVESDCADDPPTKSAFAAAKYSSPGKYGRFATQNIQPVMNPAKRPKPRLVQTYRPASSG